MEQEEHRPAEQSREAGDQRSPFDRFVESAHLKVSRPAFFVTCVAIVVLWLVSLPLWPDPKSWQVAIHTVTSVITLLLLALLENAGRRSEEAAQEKLNVIARGPGGADGVARGRGPQAARRGEGATRRGQPGGTPLTGALRPPDL